MFPPPFGRVDLETNSFLEQIQQTCCELGQTHDSAIKLASLEGFSFLTQNIANDRHFLCGNKKSQCDEVPLLLHLVDQGSLHVILSCGHAKLTTVSLCGGVLCSLVVFLSACCSLRLQFWLQFCTLVILSPCCSLCTQFSPLAVLICSSLLNWCFSVLIFNYYEFTEFP